jgi:hypothetical protein
LPREKSTEFVESRPASRRKTGNVSNVPRLRLDKTGPAAYDAAIMDSLNDPRIAVAALSSRLWNWWAVPTAR